MWVCSFSPRTIEVVMTPLVNNDLLVLDGISIFSTRRNKRKHIMEELKLAKGVAERWS